MRSTAAAEAVGVMPGEKRRALGEFAKRLRRDEPLDVDGAMVDRLDRLGPSQEWGLELPDHGRRTGHHRRRVTGTAAHIGHPRRPHTCADDRDTRAAHLWLLSIPMS